MNVTFEDPLVMNTKGMYFFHIFKNLLIFKGTSNGHFLYFFHK
jgi:hypothetical protein